MIDMNQCAADLEHFNATGELPAAWAPEVNDSELDEINRDPEIAAHLAELDAIESGCAEPPALGWTVNIRVKRPACTCADGNMAECARHGL
jgi:hypothetical protein